MNNTLIIQSNLGGKEYTAPKLKKVTSPQNELICRIAETTEIFQVKSCFESMRYGVRSLSGLDHGQMLTIIRNALEYFREKTIAGHTFDDVLQKVSLNSGLNKKAVDQHNIGHIAEFFATKSVKDFEGRFPLFNYVKNCGERTSVLRHAVFLNDTRYPVFNLSWLFLLFLKVPLVLMTTEKEPVVMNRLVTSLYRTGLPQRSLYFLPIAENYVNDAARRLLAEKRTFYVSDDLEINKRFACHRWPHRPFKPIDVFIEFPGRDGIQRIAKRLADLFVASLSNGASPVRNVFVDNYETEFAQLLAKEIVRTFEQSSSNGDVVFDLKRARADNMKLKSLSYDFRDMTSYYYSKDIIYKKDKAVASPYHFRPVVLLTDKNFTLDSDMAFPALTVKRIDRNEFAAFSVKNKVTTAVIESDSKELINGFHNVDSLQLLIKGIPPFSKVIDHEMNYLLKNAIAHELVVTMN